MAGQAKVVLKKIFSLALLFNALMTMASAVAILSSYYRVYPSWKPYAPWLLSGNLFWVAIAAGILNLHPSAAIGRTLHTGRLLFHHYVYGFLILVVTSVCVMFFTNVPLSNLFLVDSTNATINTLRAFELGGLTLFLDDLPDVNKKVESFLAWTKHKMHRIRKILFALQFATGCFAFYCGICVVLDTIAGTNHLSQNLIVLGTMLITGITSFALVKRKAWLNLTAPEAKSP